MFIDGRRGHEATRVEVAGRNYAEVRSTDPPYL